jgi:hypothetical protein
MESLERRLSLLTSALEDAEVAEKSIDIVKEIKELHTILRLLRETRACGRAEPVLITFADEGHENDTDTL